MAPSFGATIRQAREVRGLSAIEAARAAGISAAYLSKLENGGVKKPSPHVLHQLSEALAVPYAELMRLNGYRLPGATAGPAGDTVAAALFADLTDEERDELLEYLAWFRARRRSGRDPDRAARLGRTAGLGRPRGGACRCRRAPPGGSPRTRWRSAGAPRCASRSRPAHPRGSAAGDRAADSGETVRFTMLAEQFTSEPPPLAELLHW